MAFFDHARFYGEPYPTDDEPTVIGTSVYTAEVEHIGDQIATLSRISTRRARGCST